MSRRWASGRAGVVVMLCALASGGCDLFASPGSGRRDAGAPDGGDPLRPWSLGAVSRGPHAPGTWLTFEVDMPLEAGEMATPLEDLSLWVIEDGAEFPFYVARASLPARPEASLDEDAGRAADAGAGADAGADGGAPAPRSYVLAAPLPIVRPGVFHLAVGTAEGPLTRAAEIEVVVGAPRLTQAQAAAAMSAGLAGLTADVGALLHSDDPEWQALLAEGGASETVARFDAMAGDLDDLAALAAEEYMELGSDVEPGVQELLWNAGLLDSLSERAAGTSMVAIGLGPLANALLRSPVQGLLFTLDVVSMVLATFGLVCDVVAIVGAVLTAPAGGEGAALGLAPKILIAALRVVIDSVLPTDVSTIFEVQSSRLVFETEGSMVAPWATFTPQNTRLGSQLRSVEDLVLALIEAVAPGGGSRMGLREVLRRVGAYVLERLPGLGANFVFSGLTPPQLRLALPLDMGFYNVTLSQVLSINPVFAPMSAAMSAIYDPELLSPYDVVARTSGARVTAAYDTRSVGITDVAYGSASPSEQVGAILRLRAFGFGTDGAGPGGFQIVQFPMPYTVDASSRLMRVQQAPDPAQRSQRISDEDFIMLDVNLAGGGTTRVVTPETTATRAHLLLLDDLAGGRPDVTQVDVVVNGVTQVAGLIVPDGGPFPVPLVLEPGLNDLRVVATAGHTAIGCGPAGADEVCLEIEVPDADNANHRVVLYGAVGAARDFRVWTPPVFPMD